MRCYAGIGSRATPTVIQEQMKLAAAALEKEGLVLRSGGADGADSAFESGVSSKSMTQIFLPWKGYNGNQSDYYTPSQEAFILAEYTHPNWAACTEPVRKLMARNCHQVLGASLNDPSLFVLCWTEGGKGLGGTGQAIRLAKANRIPVFDMAIQSLEEIAQEINRILEISPAT